MFVRLSRKPLSDLSLKPSLPSLSVIFTTSIQTYFFLAAANVALYSCKLAKGEKGGGGDAMEEENSSGSHCCLHGEAADLADCSPHAPNPFPPQLGFDMLKYRERDRENGVIEKDSSDVASGISGVYGLYLGVCGVCSSTAWHMAIMNIQG